MPARQLSTASLRSLPETAVVFMRSICSCSAAACCWKYRKKLSFDAASGGGCEAAGGVESSMLEPRVCVLLMAALEALKARLRVVCGLGDVDECRSQEASWRGTKSSSSDTRGTVSLCRDKSEATRMNT